MELSRVHSATIKGGTQNSDEPQFELFLGQNIIRMDDRTMPPSAEIIVPEGIPDLAVEWIYKLYKGVIHAPFTGQPKNRQCMQT